MKLSAKSEYACLAMAYLGSKYLQGAISSKEIAEKYQIPKKYLEQILLSLKINKLIKSKKGMEGGYYLAKAPTEISLADIVRALDGALAPVNSVSVHFYEETPIMKNSRLVNVFREVRDLISYKMESTKLVDIME